MNEAPEPDPVASRVHCSRVETDEIVHDCEAESKAAIESRRSTVRLTKTVEHMRQKAGVDSNAGVFDFDANVVGLPRGADVDVAAGRGELHRVRQEIPQYLLQPRRVGDDDQFLSRRRDPNGHAFGVGHEADAVERRLQGRSNGQRRQIKAEFPRADTRHVDEIGDDLRLGMGVLVDQFERPSSLARSDKLSVNSMRVQPTITFSGVRSS